MSRRSLAALAHRVTRSARTPRAALGKAFPDSRWAPGWKRENGLITWDGTEWGDTSPPEVSANDYRTYRVLERHLSDLEFERALEMGCGYGRVMAWLDEFVESTCGVDPNGEALGLAARHYPECTVLSGVGQHLPFRTSAFDLVVTWTALQHVPPEGIEAVVAEIERVLEPGGRLFCSERANPSDRYNQRVWGRSSASYADLFDSMVQVASEPQAYHSEGDGEVCRRISVFERQ